MLVYISIPYRKEPFKNFDVNAPFSIMTSDYNCVLMLYIYSPHIFGQLLTVHSLYFELHRNSED